IVLVLAVIGLLPLLVLGWLSSSLNRDELERTVGGAHQATAVAAARACERWLAQSLEALQLSLAAISLDPLTPEEASTVLRIPYRPTPLVRQLRRGDGALLARGVRSARRSRLGCRSGAARIVSRQIQD